MTNRKAKWPRVRSWTAVVSATLILGFVASCVDADRSVGPKATAVGAPVTSAALRDVMRRVTPTLRPSAQNDALKRILAEMQQQMAAGRIQLAELSLSRARVALAEARVSSGARNADLSAVGIALADVSRQLKVARSSLASHR